MEITKDWLVVDLKNLIDVSEYKEEIPNEFQTEDCPGINGVSSARYGEPRFKKLHYDVKQKIELVIGEKLYPTYYFDRFYFQNTSMDRHIDREACEISVSLNISSNLKTSWPLWFDMNGENMECHTNPGDAVLYRGMEVPHWRDKMGGDKDSYFHQIFLHYVRADGYFLEFAYDQGTTLDQFTHEVPSPK